MDIIGIIFVVIILVCIVIGAINGLVKTALSLARSIFSFFFASLFSVPLANLLMLTPLSTLMSDGLQNSVFAGEAFQTIITESNKGEVIANGLTEAGLPSFINTFIGNMAGGFVTADGTQTAAQLLSSTLTLFAFSTISFFLVMLIVSILCAILIHVFKAVFQAIPAFGVTDKVLGGVLYGLIGVFFVFLISWGISTLIACDSALAEWLIETTQIGTSNFTLSKFFIENNPLPQIVTNITSIYGTKI